MPTVIRRIRLAGVCVAAVLWIATSAAALQPDEIALVINAKVPQSRELAELYARERHIPEGRIIALNLDPGSVVSPAEEMPPDVYDAQVVGVVREYLLSHNLQNRVKCLVTFWGVPLRVGRRSLTPAEVTELAKLKKDSADVLASIGKQVSALEDSARQLDPSFTAGTGTELQQWVNRFDAAMTAIFRALPSVPDPSARTARFLQALSTTERLTGSDRTKLLMAQPAVARFAPDPPSPQDVADARTDLADKERQVAAAEGRGPAPAGRQEARTLAGQSLGLFGLESLLSAQVSAFNVDQSEASFDSELSLLWWPGYPHARWVENTLQWRVQNVLRQRHAQASPTLMVTRLDGPSAEIVRSLIQTSIKVEAAGLKGQVVLDARGKTSKTDPYAVYDQTLRNLAGLVRGKTSLKVTLDNSEALIPAHSLTDIALYCGWYSLRNYSPPGSFNEGAVGFHVASFELISLRRPDEHGWVRGLLTDGVVGTLGPVAEPYLQSFPPADEFFPLLMTGRLTLAEVYWRTTPMASWMQTCIGDPLYTPYKQNPPLKAEDLPAPLQSALEPAVPSGTISPGKP